MLRLRSEDHNAGYFEISANLKGVRSLHGARDGIRPLRLRGHLIQIRCLFNPDLKLTRFIEA